MHDNSPNPSPSHSPARVMNMSEQARARPAAVVERWAAPAVEGPIIGRRVDASSVLDRQEEAAQHARGYEAGVAAGRAEMHARIAEVQARVTRLDSILKLLARPLEELDAAV